MRLVVLRASGHYQIYTLMQMGAAWVCEGPIAAEGSVTHPLPRAAFVIDSKSGARWPASRTRLAGAGSGSGAATPGVLVVTGEKGARCFANINGERIGKVDWGSKVGAVQAVQIVEKLGAWLYV